MDDSAKFTRAIRLNVAGGVAMLACVGLFLALVLLGVFDWETGMIVPLGIGVITGSLAFLTAWGLRLDRDDPAGIKRRERRLEAGAVAWGLALLLVALLSVVAIIVWGLLR